MALQLTERIYSNYDSFGTSSRKIADFFITQFSYQ